MKTYKIKYTIEETHKAKNKFDALMFHQTYLAEKLGSMIDEIVVEQKENADELI